MRFGDASSNDSRILPLKADLTTFLAVHLMFYTFGLHSRQNKDV